MTVTRCRKAQRRVSTSAPGGGGRVGGGEVRALGEQRAVDVARRSAPSARAPGGSGWGTFSVRAIKPEVAVRFSVYGFPR